MTPFQRVDISQPLSEGADICAEELVKMALHFGIELDVLVVYRPRHNDDKTPSMTAHVSDKAAIGKLLEGAYEMFLTAAETRTAAYVVSADD